jgi:hypothetical protein
MTKDEALKMAIEALLYGTDHTNAVKACKEALEQPTQEPVGYVDEFGNFEFTMQMWMEEEPNVTWTPLYTHPKQWQGLSDYEIFKIEGLDCVDEEYIKRFARAIEAKLKEKNNV